MKAGLSLRFSAYLSVFAALITVVALWFIESDMRRPLNAAKLQVDLGDIGSFAAEGRLLSSRAFHRAATASFARQHSEMWLNKVHRVDQKYVTHRPGSGLSREYMEVRSLAERELTAAESIAKSMERGTGSQDAVEELAVIQRQVGIARDRVMAAKRAGK